MIPQENSSNPDHHQVDQQEDTNPAKSSETPKDGVHAGEENSTELDTERTGEVVMNIPEILPGTDGIANVVVVCRNGTTVRLVVSCHDDRNSRPYNLCQIALTFFAQLAAVFVGNVINKSPSPCPCPCPCSCFSSQSHASDHYWTPVTVAVISLVGFVVTLISMSTTNMRATISTAIAKFGFAAVASVIIISVGMILPFHTKGNIAVTVASCIPALLAIARA